MTIHILTTEQMQKFINVIGSTPQSVAGGQFTTQQLKTLAESVKGFQDWDWPEITDDPQVNFAIDCVVQFFDEDEEEPTYDQQLYANEVEAIRTHGSFA